MDEAEDQVIEQDGHRRIWEIEEWDVEDISTAIKGMKSGKAKGMSFISDTLLKRLDNTSLATCITLVFNQCRSTGLPTWWNTL